MTYAQRKTTFLLTAMLCFWLTPGKIFAQDSLKTAQWVEAMFQHPRASSLPEFNDSYGVVFRDLNNDGNADIYVVRFRDLNRLFVNRGKSRGFRDYTIQSGLGGNLMSFGKHNLELGASAADVDNDGRQDILIVGWGETTRLFRQSQNLRFDSAIPLAEQFSPIDGNNGIWADVDRDGDLDLFITDEHHPNHLLLNDGFGRFTEQSQAFGVALPAISQGATFADLDGDDFPDLYVCNWFAPDVLYRNVRGERFEPMRLPLIHLRDSLNTNSVAFGDIDNDGDPDMLVTDRQGNTALYENNIIPGTTPWLFRNITKTVQLNNNFPAYSGVIADLNNDGRQDIFFSNIGPNQLFLNDGQRFRLVFQETRPSGSVKRLYSTGAAVADFDLDGDLDLFTANKDTHSVLYQNPLNSTNFLRISPEGVTSNRDAIGAKVWLYEESEDTSAGILQGFREISGSSGYLSAGELIAHFGVDAQKTYSARVRFPSGNEVFLENLSAGETRIISETGGLQKTATRAIQHLRRISRGKFFWLNTGLFFAWLGIIVGFIIFFIRRYRWQNNQTVMFLISVMVLGYLLLLLFSGAEIRFILLSQVAVLLIIGAVIAGFSEKIHRLERRRSGDRELLETVSHQLIFIKNNRELYEKMTGTIQQAMNVDYCSALEIDEPVNRSSGSDSANPLAIFKAAVGNWQPSEVRIGLSAAAVEMCRKEPFLKPPALRKVAPAMLQHHPSLAIPISGKEQLFAILLLGKRLDGQEFAAEDLGILQILARQAAVAIENNLYIEESKQLIQKLTEAEIREKYVTELESKNRTLEKLYRELQETQTQLIQSEKMAGLGQLVAGVAHELNNPISFVYANMKELQEYTSAITELLEALKTGSDEPGFSAQLTKKLAELDRKHDLAFLQKDIDHLIAESLEGSRRVKEVVQNLRNFSRLDEAELKAVDLHEGLDSTLMLLNTELRNRITVHKNYGDLPKVLCNPGQINQVFMNLLVNAVQAIEEKGDIWMTTRAADDHVEIEIRDSGKGIPPEIQNRIFDPFFTTKPVGKGTGLGLSVSYSIIKKHNGEILVESSPDKGTIFTIILPLKSSL